MPVHFPIEENRQDRGVKDRGRRRFGGREPTEQNAADNDERRKQCRDRNERRRQEFLERCARIDRIVAKLRVDMHGAHLRKSDQQTGNDAGQVQRADRHR